MIRFRHISGLFLAQFILVSVVQGAPGVESIMREHDAYWDTNRDFRRDLWYGDGVGTAGNLTSHGKQLDRAYRLALRKASERLAIETNSFADSLDQPSLQNLMTSSITPELRRGPRVGDRTLLDYQKNSSIMPYHLGFFDPQRLTQSPTDFFLAPKAEFLSVAAPLENYKFFADNTEAFQRKMELLLGYKLPDSVIANGQVDHPINIRSAPVYDSILVSTLFLRNDFLGHMISRALLLHADRGTKIEIIFSRAAFNGFQIGENGNAQKDLALLNQLSAHGNVSLIDAGQKRPKGDWPNALHRTHHAKVFVLVPKAGLFDRAKVIIGSRNLSDHYLYQTLPSRGQFPQLNRYDDHFFPSIDLEVEIESSILAREITTQFSNYVLNDNGGKILPSTVVRVASPKIAVEVIDTHRSRSMVRHFLHVPFMSPFRGGDLTEFFVNMIDSAKSRIDLITPYYNLNSSLLAAVQRAHGRGVEIHVVTHVDFSKEGAMGGSITAANVSGIDRTIRHATIHGWKHSHVMMHVKALIVDESHAYLGSVNFNRRSFDHDTENGIFVQSHNFARDLRQVIRTNYIPHTVSFSSERLRILKSAPLNDFAFKRFPGLF